VNSQESRRWHRRPRLLESEKAADLTDQAESVRARGLRFRASARDIASHHVQRDPRVVGVESRGQELIKDAQGTRFVNVATPCFGG
jgi:hypothetical protein